MRYQRILLIAPICLLYIGVRLWRLDESCLWFDEIFSVHAAEHPWSELFRFVALDLIHPPLFYVRLKLWIATVGQESVFWLRLLPVAISCVAIIPFLFLARELKLKTSVTAFALFLLATNGALIKYSQELRMYSLLMCLSLFSIWLFVRWTNRSSGFAWLLIANILLVYAHYFGWLVIASEFVVVLFFYRQKLLFRMLAMTGVVFAAFLPWLIAVISAAAQGSSLAQNIGWMSRPGFRELATFLPDLVEPFYHQATSAEPASVYFISLPLLLLFLVALVVFLFAERKSYAFPSASNKDSAAPPPLSNPAAEPQREFGRPTEKQSFSARREGILFLLGIFILTPIFIAFAASWILPHSIWGTRHLIIVFAPLAILLAVAITNLSSQKLRVAVMSGFVLLTTVAFVQNTLRETPQYSWCAWEPLSKEWVITPHYSSKPKQVFATEELIGYHVWFAAKEFPNNKVRVVKNFPNTNEDPAFFLPRGFEDVQKVEVSEMLKSDDFWIAFRDPDPDHDAPGIPFISRQLPVILELNRMGFEVDEQRKIRMGNESAFILRVIRRPEGLYTEK